MRDSLDYESATAPAYDAMDEASEAMRKAKAQNNRADWEKARAEYSAAQDMLRAIELRHGFRD